MENVGRIAVVFAIAFAAGFFVGRWSAPGTWEEADDPPAPAASADADPAPAEAPATSGAHPPTPAPTESPGNTRPAGSDTPDRVDELEAEVTVLRGLLDAQTRAVEGDPITWPEGRPDKFGPTGFQSAFQTAIADCQPPLDLVGFECTEPPCIAQLRVREGWHGALVNECPGWRDEYGTTVSQATFGVDCPDGATERVALLSPYDHEWRDGMDKEESGNVGLRLQHRWEQLKGDWECAP